MSELQYILFLTFTGLFALQYKQQLFVLFSKFLLELQKNKFFFKTELTNLVTQSTYLQDSTRVGCCRLPYWASSSSSTGSSPWTRMSLLKRSAARLPRSKISWLKNSGIDTQRTLVFSYSATLPGPAYSVLLRVNGLQILSMSVYI